MTAPESAPSSYGSAQDWSKVISGMGQGASAGMQSTAASAASRAEAKEAKRRTLANLLSQALKRKQGLFRVGQDHADDMSDFKSQAMQQMAQGFVGSLK